MKIYTLIYDSFTQFEVVLANYFLKTKYEVLTVGLNDHHITSGEGFITKPHYTIMDLNISEIDLFIIPGGNPEFLVDNKELYDLLVTLVNNKIKVAAICSGVLHLANSGVLKGRKYTTTLPIENFKSFNKDNYLDDLVVTDHNIITAKANGYVDFALQLGRVMNIYKNEDDFKETVSFFREFKS